MSTRFDSFKNKPNSQIMSPKRKVLKEFQMLQRQLRDINAKDVDGEADWNETINSKNGRFNATNHTTNPKSLSEFVEAEQKDPKSTTHGKMSSADDGEVDYEGHFTHKEADGMKGIAARYHSLENEQSRARVANKAKFNEFGDKDPQNFSSFTHDIRYPRSTGFIDFNLQMKRPAFTINKAHEHRFQYIDHFPDPHSGVKSVPKTNFKKQLRRDPNALMTPNLCKVSIALQTLYGDPNLSNCDRLTPTSIIKISPKSGQK